MHPIQAAMLAMREIAELLGYPWDVDCYRGGEKNNELASGALHKPGRGDGRDGKKDQGPSSRVSYSAGIKADWMYSENMLIQ
ncbi:MAG: hypothetical protein QG575_2157 [Euryarchaeota archaeon]|nr:hypothetical protein [Euryarchaeota archaeon]